ncbi:LLM class flavin-dependent oxidoreductase [Priestia aryabhattai]|uniref:LLM class flavin-dependent oxidoreductase n=1 Tax=Priestia aryabhattai TaxID=412384 RepID=UPI002E212A29|nr:LLM class flavin-dependent oxidoreductase [Priestia aryabhattai]
MKLSILDQSYISSGRDAKQALQESMMLAQIGEKLGYNRYWIAEHHNIAGLSCPTPEVMLSYIGAHTEKIRLGSGAVLLPYYKPYKIAETYNMLATLFPNRIDIGVGRGPGGSDEAKEALSNNYLEEVRRMDLSFTELLHFLYNDFPSKHIYSKITAFPLPANPPNPWILGTSKKSAIFAAENGLPYAFGQFISDKDGVSIVNTYANSFKSVNRLKHPQSILAISVICAETKEMAEELSLSNHVWELQLAKGEGISGIPSIEEANQYLRYNSGEVEIKNMKERMILGTPKEVRQKLLELSSLYQVDEIMIVTAIHSFADRIRSFELIAKELA